MPKCSFCQKKTPIGRFLKCKWCTKDLCIACLAIEIHKCENCNDCKQAGLKDLTNKLESGKTKSVKI